MNLYSHKDSNTRKTWLLIALFLILTIGIGWVFSYAFGTPLILYVAVFISILMSFLSYWHSDKIVLAMTHAKLIKSEDNLELYRIVENLCIAAGLPTPKIYVINTPALNAFAT